MKSQNTRWWLFPSLTLQLLVMSVTCLGEVWKYHQPANYSELTFYIILFIAPLTCDREMFFSSTHSSSSFVLFFSPPSPSLNLHFSSYWNTFLLRGEKSSVRFNYLNWSFGAKTHSRHCCSGPITLWILLTLFQKLDKNCSNMVTIEKR